MAFEYLAKFRGMLFYNMPIMPSLCSKIAYYASIMLDALTHLLCLKLCRHNRHMPNDLCHGYTIGYTGPQFSYSVNNLVSAYQYPDVIDASLEKECQLYVGRILGPFESPPLPNF